MPLLTTGDPAPWFTLPSTSNPDYHFDTVGGHRVILFFFGSSKLESAAKVLQDFCQLQAQLQADNVPFFGVSIDPNDGYLAETIENPTFYKFLWDFERQVSLQYGVCQPVAGDSSLDLVRQQVRYVPMTFVLDESLHVLRVFPIENPATHVAQVMQFLQNLPAPEPPTVADRQAPVLFIPKVFDPELCQHLIHLYETDGGQDSGFMRQIDGKTVEVLDYEFKKRRDFVISDPALLEKVNSLILRRIKPEVEKAFQFTITRFERHLVACYEASDRGFFNRHRDNTTKGTAHRRFAMSLNLNTGEYEGGCLRFPEYGSRLYRPAAGEAIIFSCSLLHEATPVTSGRRFALLSFFYDDEGAKIREQNQKYVLLNKRSGLRSEPIDDRPQPSKMSGGFQPKPRQRPKR